MGARALLRAGCVLMCLLLASPGYGLIINASDDTFITEDSPDAANGASTDLVSQARHTLDTAAQLGPAYKQTFIEFTLGPTAATSADFYIMCKTARTAFVGIMYGKEWSFDETGADGLTWNKFWGPAGYNTEGSWPSQFQGGSWNDADPNRIAQTSFDAVNDGWERASVNIAGLGNVAGLNALDITDFYNNHLGQTITLAFWGWAPLNGNAVLWHSKETITEGAVGPYLDVIEIPEPSALVLLLVGGAALGRRR